MRRSTAALVALGAVLGAGPAAAQVRASERGNVSQTVDGTVITVDYGRPRLRGRTAFGGIVHWGEIWTPGANFSTTIAVSRPVRIDGQAVPAGKYSAWVEPRETGWKLYLHKDPTRYHLQRPAPAEMFLTLPVTPTTVAATELLTFSFPEVRRDGATLQFRWDTSAVSLRIDVEPTAPARRPLPEAALAPYVGDYDGAFFPEHGDSVPMRFTLRFRAGRLEGLMGDGRRPFELVPTGTRHRFWFEVHDEQGPFDQELASPIVFTVDRRGRATGFTMRGYEQPLWLQAARAPRVPG